MMDFPLWVHTAAHFPDPQHRIWLRRKVSIFPTFPVIFILHNPSKADGERSDPTFTRCMRFTITWGGSETIFVNAVTGVATNADDLALMSDPVGALADEAIQVAAEYCEAHKGILVAAWGAPKGKPRTRALMSERFIAIKNMRLPLNCIRITAKGYPEHPLYLPAGLRPIKWDY